MIDLNSPLDVEQAEAPAFLSGIQGNIIKGHGRDHTAHLFLRAKGTAEARAAAWEFARLWVKTAQDLLKESETWRTLRRSGGIFGMLSLSASGYRALGYPEEIIPRPPHAPGYQPFHDNYFLFGMKRQAELERRYNDPGVDMWELGYRGEVHAMAMLADDDRASLDAAVEKVSAVLSVGFQILAVERGDVLRKTFPRGRLDIEHFGYQDGVSQPLMIQQDVAREVAARGNTHWDPAAPLSLVLVEEPGATKAYGSFMVFRKLEQDVRAFQTALNEMAQKHPLSAVEIGAMAVGRNQDGTPLLPTASPPGTDGNDFHYDQDADGAKCPFHAHIRKTNPRGDIARILGGSNEFERSRRIARRGITYGRRPDIENATPNALPQAGVGLLFMCFQSNLDQFAIQQEGSDTNDFVQAGVGLDPIIGQNAAPTEQRWPSTGLTRFTLTNFVRMLGGEYFFAPSMAFLATLAPR